MATEVNIRGDGAGHSAGSSVGTDPRLYLRDDELDRGVGLLLQSERILMGAANDAAEASGLSPAELSLMLTILYWPGRDVSTVRDDLGATTPTLARVLGRLDRRGLIRKERTGGDGRRRALHLSEAGEALVTPIAEAMRVKLRTAYRSVGPEAVTGARLLIEALGTDAVDDK